MVYSSARTVTAYLDELPPERRAVMDAMLELIRRNLRDGFEESIGFGMITFSVPLSRYPKTYNNQPLLYAALAAQKNFYAVYLMSVYEGQPAKLKEEFEREGKKLDIGKSCIRFKALGDLSLNAIASVISHSNAEEYITWYEKVKGSSGSGKTKPARKVARKSK